MGPIIDEYSWVEIEVLEQKFGRFDRVFAMRSSGTRDPTPISFCFLVRFLLSGLVIAAGSTLSFFFGRVRFALLAIDFLEHDG